MSLENVNGMDHATMRMASALLVAIPVFILYMLFQEVMLIALVQYKQMNYLKILVIFSLLQKYKLLILYQQQLK